MARTLPWLKDQRTEARQARDSPTPKRRRVDPDGPSKPSSSSKRSIAKMRARTPSTSPPPQPPAQEFMREGLDQDDCYIMVEDEFLSTAQSFTQHLHHAEYLRLKSLAQSKSRDQIKTLSRPVDTTTTMPPELKKAKEMEEKKARQKKALKGVLDEDETTDDDTRGDPWVGTRLQGLMMSASQTRRNLAAVAGVKGVSATRAAAGFENGAKTATITSVSRGCAPVDEARTRQALSPEDPPDSEEDEDEDDLDAPVYVKIAAKTRRMTSLRETGTVARRTPLGTASLTDNHFRPRPPGRVDNSAAETRAKTVHTTYTGGDAFDAFPKPRALPSDTSHILSKRIAKLKAAKVDAEDKKPIEIDEIPTFLV